MIKHKTFIFLIIITVSLIALKIFGIFNLSIWIALIPIYPILILCAILFIGIRKGIFDEYDVNN